jgi:UDP-glucose 4-epimerase
VAIFARQMVRGAGVVINGSGEQVRDFVYVDDIVSANLLAQGLLTGQIYNLGTGVGTSINQLFASMKSLTGYAQEPVYAPPKAGETFKIYLDASKARTELGWQPEVGLEQGLRATITSYS